MKIDGNGNIVLDQPYEERVIREIDRLLKIKKEVSGQYADWELRVICSENGSNISMRVNNLDKWGKDKIQRPRGKQ